MRFHRLRPRNGWRVFAGEVGVIVLGVLLALGAQQAVEDWQVRQDVAVFRQTIDREIGYNLWIYRARDRQTECTEGRLAQLSRLLNRSVDGAPVALADTRRPHSFSEYRSAWDNRDADTFAELPPDIRQRYAEFYDELANNVANRRAENDVWVSMIPYEVRAPMTTADRRLLHQALRQAQTRNERIHDNMGISYSLGESLGIRPLMPNGMYAKDIAAISRCPTLVKQAA